MKIALSTLIKHAMGGVGSRAAGEGASKEKPRRAGVEP